MTALKEIPTSAEKIFSEENEERLSGIADEMLKAQEKLEKQKVRLEDFEKLIKVFMHHSSDHCLTIDGVMFENYALSKKMVPYRGVRDDVKKAEKVLKKLTLEQSFLISLSNLQKFIDVDVNDLMELLDFDYTKAVYKYDLERGALQEAKSQQGKVAQILGFPPDIKDSLNDSYLQFEKDFRESLLHALTEIRDASKDSSFVSFVSKNLKSQMKTSEQCKKILKTSFVSILGEKFRTRDNRFFVNTQDSATDEIYENFLREPLEA